MWEKIWIQYKKKYVMINNVSHDWFRLTNGRVVIDEDDTKSVRYHWKSGRFSTDRMHDFSSKRWKAKKKNNLLQFSFMGIKLINFIANYFIIFRQNLFLPRIWSTRNTSIQYFFQFFFTAMPMVHFSDRFSI